MSKTPLSGRLLSAFGILRSAVAAAAAADANRTPRARDLRRLGIDPDQYGRIGR